MNNVYLYKANYFLWIGITTFHEKLITLYLNIFFKISWVIYPGFETQGRRHQKVKTPQPQKEIPNVSNKLTKTWFLVELPGMNHKEL